MTAVTIPTPPAPPAGTAVFNPPPSWGAPPGFDPRRGHLTDPVWPAAPAGWQFWVAPARTPGVRGLVERIGTARVVGTCVLLLVVGVFATAIATNDPIPTGVGSCWGQAGGANRGLVAVRCSAANAEVEVVSEVSAPEKCPATTDGYFEVGSVVQCVRDLD